mmetsp:Transcript_8129/g.22037  ORF Transcript_8129/g.22037 Transcript_8129/m.22037 type:complete len:117 (-) Transcript_8129:1568-1918(-)
MSGKSTELVNSLLAGPARENVGGILCNDPSGLCLVAKGAMGNAERSGIYTNLTRLAAQLRSSPEDGTVADATSAAPLITIEADDSAILVKDYDGRTMAVRVPVKAVAETPASSDAA